MSAWLSIGSVGAEENCCLVEKKEEEGDMGENGKKIDDNEGTEGLNSSGSRNDGEEQQQEQQQLMDVDNDNIGGGNHDDGTMIEIECKEERVEDDKEEEKAEEEAEEVEQEFFETSITLAKRLLFLGYCELDGGQISSARQRLVRVQEMIVAENDDIPHISYNFSPTVTPLNYIFRSLSLSLSLTLTGCLLNNDTRSIQSGSIHINRKHNPLLHLSQTSWYE